MKSKRAKEYLERIELLKNHPPIMSGYRWVIEIAEQEAEERAIKAANMLYEDLAPILLHTMKREWVIDKFKEFYNK